MGTGFRPRAIVAWDSFWLAHDDIDVWCGTTENRYRVSGPFVTRAAGKEFCRGTQDKLVLRHDDDSIVLQKSGGFAREGINVTVGRPGFDPATGMEHLSALVRVNIRPEALSAFFEQEVGDGQLLMVSLMTTHLFTRQPDGHCRVLTRDHMPEAGPETTRSGDIRIKACASSNGGQFLRSEEADGRTLYTARLPEWLDIDRICSPWGAFSAVAV